MLGHGNGMGMLDAIAAGYRAFTGSGHKTSMPAEIMNGLLNDLRSGHAHINLILAPNPLVISKDEHAVAVLPQTTLLEPTSLRVREGTRISSNIRWSRGYSRMSGNYNSTIESRDALRAIDIGTLILTDRRIAFLGSLKTVTIDLGTVLGIDARLDGVVVHCDGKRETESFKISDALKLSYEENPKLASAPVTGQLLGHLISQVLASIGRDCAINDGSTETITPRWISAPGGSSSIPSGIALGMLRGLLGR